MIHCRSFRMKFAGADEFNTRAEVVAEEAAALANEVDAVADGAVAVAALDDETGAVAEEVAECAAARPRASSSFAV